MKPRISVVMATHNGERFLAEQIESIGRQSLAPCELVIGDDDSSDGTDEIVAHFARHAPFPVIYTKNRPKLGFRDNFIQGTARATGEWIAFCDQDDVWHADKLRRCAAFTARPEVTQIVHQANLVAEDGSRTGLFGQGISRNCVRPPLSYDVWGTFWGFSMIVRREVLGAVPAERRYVDYIDPRFPIAHDRWAFFLAHTFGWTAEIAEPLVDYRQHSANLFGAGKPGRAAQAEPRKRELERNRHYIAATREMLAIVQSLPPSVESGFPAFDRQRAQAVYLHALRQVETRQRIYGATRLVAAALCLRALCAGGYGNAQNGTTRWRSFMKDMLYSVGTSRA